MQRAKYSISKKMSHLFDMTLSINRAFGPNKNLTSNAVRGLVYVQSNCFVQRP